MTIAWWWALIALYVGIALGIAISTICREWAEAGSAADDASPRPKSRAAGGM